MSVVLKVSGIVGLLALTFFTLRLTVGGMANVIFFVILLTTIIISLAVLFIKGQKHHGKFTVPAPAQLSGYRKLYKNYDFLGGDFKYTEDFNSAAYTHPAQTMDRVAALLMYTNRAAKFNEKQICILASGWAELMLGMCKEGHYPGYGQRYKDKDLPPQLLTGAVYNGMYRALQADYSPNYDVDCLISEQSLTRYILLVFDSFINDSENFGHVGDNCIDTLQKLRKFFRTRG